MRNTIPLVAFALSFVSLGAHAAEKPNVLFIAVDDLRPALGCFGDVQVKSPNIDRLAADGLIVERAYCNIPVCGASRASLMTSIYPTARRFKNFLTRAAEDTPGASTLPQVFKGNGYATLSNGKVFHHSDDCGEASWAEPAWRPVEGGAAWLDPESGKRLSRRKRGRIYEHPDVEDNAYADGRIAEKTIADLRRLKREGKPFFLACGFFKPHMPFYAPKKYWDLYDRDKLTLADNRYRPKDAPMALRGSGEFRSYYLAGLDPESDAFHRVMRHGYLACVSYVDKLIGDVLAELDRLELRGNTIVVLWGDHGWHLGEHDFWGKHNTMHLALRVPLIIQAPGKPAGRKTSSLVETVDIFPTLCELAGLQTPASVQGRSMVPLLDRPEQPFREHVHSRYGLGDAVVTERYAFTRYSGKGDGTMLYDHRTDPGENLNVAGNPEYRDAVMKMEKLLAARMREARSAKW